MQINKSYLQQYADAFVLFEIATHGVDPRETVEGTSLRIKEDEGYKYLLYDECRAQLRKGEPYVDKILSFLPPTYGKNNLVYRMKRGELTQSLDDAGFEMLELALEYLYESDDDEVAFSQVAAVAGGQFDLLGFLFFLKNRNEYLPIRPQVFDSIFNLLGFNSDLAGHCTWEKYQQFNEWIKEVRAFLVLHVNAEMTLLDAHSFLWTIGTEDKGKRIKGFLNKTCEIVEHKQFGKGVIVQDEGDLIVAQFAGIERKFFKKDVDRSGLLTTLHSTATPVDDARFPEEINEENEEIIYEGAKKQVVVNAYERDPRAKEICKEYYIRRDGRIRCQICGFDFGEVYGPEYTNMIHVHHITPISEIGEEYAIEPTKDLIPVCPNCHMVLHAKRGISVEELKEKIRKRCTR